MKQALQSALNRIGERPAVFLFLLIGVQLLMHLDAMDKPPVSVHTWRQSNTLAMARNFYDEDMNILRPRVDSRFDKSGVTGAPFPAYEYVLAGIYKVTGFHENIHRWYAWFWFSLALIAIYGLAFSLTGSRQTAMAAAWIFGFVPEWFYTGFNAMPDNMAMALSLFAAWLYFASGKANRTWQWIAVCLLLVIAGMIKIQFLIAAVLIAGAEWQLYSESKDLRRLMFRLAGGILTVAAVLGWYAYARWLTEQTGLYEYHMSTRLPSGFAEWLDIANRLFVSAVPDMLLGYPLLLVLLLAAFYSRKGETPVFPVFTQWLLVLALSGWIFLQFYQFRNHLYYLLVALPWVVIWAAAKFPWKQWFWLSAILIVSLPIYAWIRIVPVRWWPGKEAVEPVLLQPSSREALDNAVPDSAMCIVGPDPSCAIWFYYLHKQGFPYRNCAELTQKTPGGKTMLRDARDRGARYLYTTSECLQHDSVKVLVEEILLQKSNMAAVRLLPR